MGFKNSHIYKRLRQSKTIMRLYITTLELKDNFKEMLAPDSPMRFFHGNEKYYKKRIQHWEKDINKRFADEQTSSDDMIEFGYKKDCSDPNKIAVILEKVSGRSVKIVQALQRKGYLIEAYYDTHFNVLNDLIAEMKEIAVSWKEYSNPGELMAELIDSSAFICHYFMEGYDAGNACTLLKHKEWFPPIVVEHYDVLNGMYTNLFSKYYKRERFAFENSAGVVFREYSGEYLEHYLKFKMKNQIIFLDFISKDQLVDGNMNKGSEEELSIGYGGGFWCEIDGQETPQACLSKYVEVCEKNMCGIYFYPVSWDEDRYQRYIQLSAEKKYFHFCKPIPYNRLIEKLSECDFGFVPSTRQIYAGKPEKEYTVQKEIYAGTNKMFDYIAAGLPIIAAGPFLFLNEFDRYGMVLRWTLEDMDFDEMRKRRRELKENVFSNRYHFLIENRIDELIDFYKKAAKEEDIK